jgi:hypothetical protein
MTAIFITKRESLWIGMTEADQDQWDKFKRWLKSVENGESFKLEWTRPRNLKMHRKLFAMLTVVSEYSEVYDTTDKALIGIKILIGHCDYVPNPHTGDLIAVPRSLSFSKCEQGEFEELYGRMVNAAIKYMVPTMDKAAIDEAVERLIRF